MEQLICHLLQTLWVRGKAQDGIVQDALLPCRKHEFLCAGFPYLFAQGF